MPCTLAATLLAKGMKFPEQVQRPCCHQPIKQVPTNWSPRVVVLHCEEHAAEWWDRPINIQSLSLESLVVAVHQYLKKVEKGLLYCLQVFQQFVWCLDSVWETSKYFEQGLWYWRFAFSQNSDLDVSGKQRSLALNTRVSDRPDQSQPRQSANAKMATRPRQNGWTWLNIACVGQTTGFGEIWGPILSRKRSRMLVHISLITPGGSAFGREAMKKKYIYIYICTSPGMDRQSQPCSSRHMSSSSRIATQIADRCNNAKQTRMNNVSLVTLCLFDSSTPSLKCDSSGF